MYRERTYDKNRAMKKFLIGLLIVLLVVCVAFVIYCFAHESAKEQGAASIRQTILDAATQCAAVEGAYPSSLKHLEDAYGVTINHDEYNIIFESYAANLPPNVVVTPK